MKKLNLNQRKALTELMNNLAVSVVVIGLVTPMFSKESTNSINIINIIFVILISLTMISFSNYMLK